MAISNTITLLIHNIKVKRVSLLLHIWRSCVQRGMRWCSWLRHCATSQKTVGSIPDGVIGIFHWHNPSSYTMALGSTQPLKKMSTRNISWVVKAANSYSSQPYHLHVLSWNVGISGWKPSGPVTGIDLPFYLHLCSNLGPGTGYPEWGLCAFFSVPPHKFCGANSDHIMTTSFHIFSKPLFTNHPTIQHQTCIVWATDNALRYMTYTYTHTHTHTHTEKTPDIAPTSHCANGRLSTNTPYYPLFHLAPPTARKKQWS